MQIEQHWKGICGIYKIQINNHIYVGSSINIFNRACAHLSYLRRGTHSNQYLQRVYNKYGESNMSYEIVEKIQYTTKIALLERELFYIEFFNADLNLKKDPTTEYNCITTSKPVYQFNLFGELIKVWNSVSEAGRRLGVDSSGISVSCNRRSRQRICANSLWSFSEEYNYPIEILYVFSLDGNFLDRFTSTTDIYQTYFSNKPRKTVLSQLRKKIDSGTPYINILIYTDRPLEVPDQTSTKLQLERDLIKQQDPIVNHYTRSGKLIESKPLSEYDNKNLIARRLFQNHSLYTLTDRATYQKAGKSIICTNINSNEIRYFNRQVDAARELFNESNGRNIYKHLKRNTPYKGWLFTFGTR